MNNQVTVYKNVFNRENPKQFDFIDFIKYPEKLFNSFDLTNYEEELTKIKSLLDKEERNIAKRNFIPAVDLSASGILSIDIDNIFDKPDVKEKVIERLKKNDNVYIVMESVSGNVVVYFKYECYTKEFPFLYYKIYLELTLLLSVNIDFLPEIGRLRYVSTGEIYHFNDNSNILTEILEVDTLPYINTSVSKDKARKISFGSK